MGISRRDDTSVSRVLSTNWADSSAQFFKVINGWREIIHIASQTIWLDRYRTTA